MGRIDQGVHVLLVGELVQLQKFNAPLNRATASDQRCG